MNEEKSTAHSSNLCVIVHDQSGTADRSPGKSLCSLPWLCPTPHTYREEQVLETDVSGFAFSFVELEESVRQDLTQQADELGLCASDGWPCSIALFKEDSPESDLSADMALLQHRTEAYRIEADQGHIQIVAGGYQGAVHALVRLRQWLDLPAENRPLFRMLDFPLLDFRGMNRDECEDWSPAYWNRTISCARSIFANHLAISVERAVLAYASGLSEEYSNYVRCFRDFKEKARSAGITLFPMFYNMDHMLGQFLKAAGYDRFCCRRNRLNIRYESPEAWSKAVDIVEAVFADMGCEKFAVWMSENSHAIQGDKTLKESQQWGCEADFLADLLRRLRQKLPDVSLLAILSQGTRDHIGIFAQAFSGLPVDIVHYDGEWTYGMPAPISLPASSVKCVYSEGNLTVARKTPPLTTYGVAHSLESGARWICKPAWNRIAYLGFPFIRPDAIYRECSEIISAGYIGVFPNCSRWETNFWNLKVGSAAAWGGQRSDVRCLIDSCFHADQQTGFSADDVLRLEEIWTHVSTINIPTENAPRFSEHRALMFHMPRWIEEACYQADFKISPFEEAYFLQTWQNEAGWLEEASTQISRWESLLERDANQKQSEGYLWEQTLPLLGSIINLQKHALAAAYIVCREGSPDNAIGPWRAWRKLLALHVRQAADAIENIMRFQAVDQIVGREHWEGDHFEIPAEVGSQYGFIEPLTTMLDACKNVLSGIEDPDSFSAFKAADGFEGPWPSKGLYSVLDWPVRIFPNIFEEQ